MALRSRPTRTQGFAANRLVPGPRALGLLLLLILVAVRALDPAPLRYLRVRTFDLYQLIMPRERITKPVIIVDIDDSSLAALGQWPWPRTLLADLVTSLFDQGVALVAFDIVFPELDRTSPAALARRLPDGRPDVKAWLETLPDNSAVLAEAMARGPVILGLGMTPNPVSARPTYTAPPAMAVIGEDPRPALPKHGHVLGNLSMLTEAAAGQGIFIVSPEDDGIIRRVPMVLNTDGNLWPSLSSEILRVATGTATMAVRARATSGHGVGSTGIEGLVIGPLFVPTDAEGRLWVHFARPDPSRFVSAADVIIGNVEIGRLVGRVAIIGTSAVGLLDIKTTPVSQSMPGVEVHAQVIESILDGTVLSRSRLADAREILLTLGLGLVLIVLLPRLGATWGIVMVLVGVGALAAGSWVAFGRHQALMDPTFPAMTLVALHILLSYTSYARTEEQRQRIRDAFSRYMTPALVERLADSPSELRLGGETREMTILFCDIRRFTTLSEGYDAEGLTTLINRFMTPMSDVIMTHNGTIDKYIGDCIMAFWNAPLDDPDHATNAARAVLAMSARLQVLNAELAAEAARDGRTVEPLRIGIGVNTGWVSVGNMGSEQRFDYSVLGDAVNLASRLEGLAKVYDLTAVVGEATAEKLDGFTLLEVDRIRVRGRQALTRVFALLGGAEMADRPEVAALQANQTRLLDAMSAQTWDRVAHHLDEARRLAVAAGLDLTRMHDAFEQRLQGGGVAPPERVWGGLVATGGPPDDG